MNMTYHPDTSTLTAYAAGAVTEGFSLVIAAHLESCQECREKVAQAEAVGGGLLDELPDAVMADTSLGQIWERIAAAPAAVPTETRPTPRHSDLPGVLQAFIPGGLDAVKWRTLVPGIKQFLLSDVDSDQGSVRLLNIAPGTTVPHHTHFGSELTLVLRGSYSDETGHYRRGDLADVDSSVHHQPVVDSDQPCICLIATDQRLRFTGALNRMLQPLVGM